MAQVGPESVPRSARNSQHISPATLLTSATLLPHHVSNAVRAQLRGSRRPKGCSHTHLALLDAPELVFKWHRASRLRCSGNAQCVHRSDTHGRVAPMPSVVLPTNYLFFWINAFIPRDVPGYTLYVPSGVNQGKTMIPGPVSTFSISTPSFAWPASRLDLINSFAGRTYRVQEYQKTWHAVGVSDCYLTDQRTFSDDIDAKSRMHSRFVIDLDNPKAGLLAQYHNCDVTTEIDCEDGCVECSKCGDTRRMKFRHRVGRWAFDQHDAVISWRCAASNPCSYGAHVVGDIDHAGMIALRAGGHRDYRTLEYNISIDVFPAFEAYIRLMKDGILRAATVLEEGPTPGKTVHDLIGDPSRRFSGSIQLW